MYLPACVAKAAETLMTVHCSIQHIKEHCGHLARATQCVPSAAMTWPRSAPSSLGIYVILTLLPFLIFPLTPLLFSSSNGFPHHHQEWMTDGETMYLGERTAWKVELPTRI